MTIEQHAALRIAEAAAPILARIAAEQIEAAALVEATEPVMSAELAEELAELLLPEALVLDACWPIDADETVAYAPVCAS